MICRTSFLVALLSGVDKIAHAAITGEGSEVESSSFLNLLLIVSSETSTVELPRLSDDKMIVVDGLFLVEADKFEGIGANRIFFLLEKSFPPLIFG